VIVRGKIRNPGEKKIPSKKKAPSAEKGDVRIPIIKRPKRSNCIRDQNLYGKGKLYRKSRPKADEGGGGGPGSRNKALGENDRGRHLRKKKKKGHAPKKRREESFPKVLQLKGGDR